LESSSNSLISLPTSTGKTLVGELLIAAALGTKPGLAVYVAPYVAIGMQASRALKQHLPKPYRVHTLVAGLTSDLQIRPSHFPEVVVTTPERFDAMLRRLETLENLRVVIVDEAHVVSDGARGVRLEALLARLRLKQQNGYDFKIVALSAVMTQSDRFREWLGVPDDQFITCLWRPTARRVAIWRTNNKLTWLYAGDELRPASAKATTIFGTKSLVWPERMYPADGFAQTKAQAPALFANAAFLCRQMYEEVHEPILCVCASRASSRGVAYRLAEDFEPNEVLDEALQKSVDYIESFAPHLTGLKACIQRGVAFHNAALPVELRQLIEAAVERRVMKVVCATTTLAEGVDLPFRVTVLAEWLQWKMDTRDQQKPFGALKFRNIAGRSGRAGVFTEGDTIVFENVLGPSRYADNQNRTASILSMMENPSEVGSALEEDVFPAELEARRRVLSSSFLAAIRENPKDEALEKSFAKKLLGRRLPNGDSIDNVTAKIRADVLSGGPLAFAEAASPLRLTPLGEAANQTVFSPESCRLIVQAIGKLGARSTFSEIASFLLLELGGVPEQHNHDWSKISTNQGSRFVVKAQDLPAVLQAWRSLTTLPQIFSQLPSVRKSKAKDSVADWLEGKELSENWSNSFDKFSDFVDSVLEEFLPWLIDACAILHPHLPNQSQLPSIWAQVTDIITKTIEARHASSSEDDSRLS
jgi:helicase